MPTMMLSPDDLAWYDVAQAATDHHIAKLQRYMLCRIRRLNARAQDDSAIDRVRFEARTDHLECLLFQLLCHADALHQRLYSIDQIHGIDGTDP